MVKHCSNKHYRNLYERTATPYYHQLAIHSFTICEFTIYDCRKEHNQDNTQHLLYAICVHIRQQLTTTDQQNETLIATKNMS